TCPRTSPAPLALFQEPSQYSAGKPRGLAGRQPGGPAAHAAPDEPLSFQAREPLGDAAGVVARQRDQAGDRPVPIQHEHGATPADVLEVTRKVVLQVGYLGPFHIAMLAMSWPGCQS